MGAARMVGARTRASGRGGAATGADAAFTVGGLVVVFPLVTVAVVVLGAEAVAEATVGSDACGCSLVGAP